MTLRATEDRRLAAALLLVAAAVGVGLLAIGWGRWPDVLIDFGRELYVPWRLAEGEVLYRDLAWFNGPLSPFVNALLFRVFGVGFWTLAIANLVWLVVLALLMHRLWRRVAGPVGAAAGCALFAAVFAVGQQVGVGNYNFMSPYSHDATHGLLLAVATMACALRSRGSGRWSLATGLLLGLTFLTKVEMSLAAGLGVLAAFVALRIAARDARRWGRDAGLTVLGVALPVGLAFAGLAAVLPVSDAVRGTLGSWTNVGNEELSALDYYRRGLGLDRPGEHLVEMATSVGWCLVAFAPGLVLGLLVRGSGRAPRIVAAVGFAVGVGVGLVAVESWRWLARATPALLACVALGAAWGLLRTRPQDSERGDGDRERARAGDLVALSVFALALLAKIGLQVRFGHYGFVLAAFPAGLVAALAVGRLPNRIGAMGGSALVTMAGTLAIFVGVGSDAFHKSVEQYARKTVPVGTGRDRFLADVRGESVNELMRVIAERVPAGEEVVVLPEGVLVNYLLRRRTPTPYVNFMPPELILFGEAEILGALEARPPGAVVLAHKDTSEYGYPYFGTDYAASIGGWVRELYRHVWTDPRGGPPLQRGTDFGLSLLERKP